MAINWIELFREQYPGTIWKHDGNPKRAHALLTSGLHSNGYVNCSLVTQNTQLLEGIVSTDDGLLSNLPTSDDNVDWVIGSAMGAITFAYSIAKHLRVKAGFTEKIDSKMVLSRFEVQLGHRVLVVEDTISTGGSTLKTLEGIRNSGVPDSNILPYIVCIVNRSGSKHLEGREIRSLLDLDIHSWTQDECPLCKLGSKAVRPKGNWSEMMAKS